MRASECDILVLPGLGGGTAQHWYMRWTQKLSSAHRVDQKDFDRPVLQDWVAVIVEAAGKATKPVVLLAHDLGAYSAVHASARLDNVAAALLVAPPSQEKIAAMSAVDPCFADPVLTKLKHPALLVASRTDPYCPYGQSEELASLWGAEPVDAGDSGHIDPDSGHGPWPEGLLRFAHFLSALPAQSNP